MTFEDAEISVSESQPVELFDFAFDTSHWRYTSGAIDIEHLGKNFKAKPIRRTSISADSQKERAELTITVGRLNPFARQFIFAPLEGEASLTIYRGQSTFWSTYWNGNVANVSLGTLQHTITCKPTLAATTRLGLRRKFSRQCTHDVYGDGCMVLKTAYKVTGTILTVSGVTVTGAAFATKSDQWFRAGYLVVGNVKRMIKDHVGTTITLTHPMLQAVAGNAFTAYPGCDKTRDTCKAKFFNGINYGGQAWMPKKNPFSGDPIV